VHARPLQHPSEAQLWPKEAQPRPPPGLPEEPASLLPVVLPASPAGGGENAAHVPSSAPGAITQVIPAQQSALEVHAPLVGMQAAVAHVS